MTRPAVHVVRRRMALVRRRRRAGVARVAPRALHAGRAQFLSFQAPLDETRRARAGRRTCSTACGTLAARPMPDEHLHISLRGVGFQVIRARSDDELTREDVGRAGEFAARALRAIEPIEVTRRSREHLPGRADPRSARRRGAGGDPRRARRRHAHDTLIDDGHYLPHVTIAMFDDPAAAAPSAIGCRALRELAAAPVTLRRIDLARWWFTGLRRPRVHGARGRSQRTPCALTGTSQADQVPAPAASGGTLIGARSLSR